MKKIYLLFSFLFVTTVSNVFAQVPSCSYDFAWLATGREGIYPDSATNLMSGNVGTPYLQNLTVLVPYDTVSAIGTVTFKTVDLQRNITSPVNYGLPPGLSIGTTAPNVTTTTNAFKFPGNDTSCMVIYGTPTTAGTYNLSFTLKTFVHEVPFAAVSTDVLTYYKITIDTPIGLKENSNSKFELMNLYPNPSNSNATLRFNSPKSSIVKLSVYNTLGKVVMSKTIDSKQGENEFNLNVKDLSSGIYICSLESEGKTLTKKLIVSKD